MIVGKFETTTPLHVHLNNLLYMQLVRNTEINKRIKYELALQRIKHSSKRST